MLFILCGGGSSSAFSVNNNLNDEKLIFGEFSILLIVSAENVVTLVITHEIAKGKWNQHR